MLLVAIIVDKVIYHQSYNVFVVVLQLDTYTTEAQVYRQGLKHIRTIQKFEPVHDKAYNRTCATSEDSDQPAHPRSLIIVFADRMCLLQPLGLPKRDEREYLPYWVDVQADFNLLVTYVLL